MDFYQLAKARYAVKKFDGRHVKKSKLNEILKAGQIAPTAKNIQPQRIYVIESKEALEKINKVCKCIYGASTVLLVCYDKDVVWKNPFSGESSGPDDCAIVLTHMMLSAQDNGINSCWVKFFDPKEVAAEFGLPQNIVPCDIMPLGYAAEDALPLPNHNTKKEISELVTRL